MDYGHDSFVVHARLYPDDPTVYTILWYVARADAPRLKGPKALCNLIWSFGEDEWIDTAVGQVFDGFYEDRPNAPNLLALGTGICGTKADFAGDGVYNGAAPYPRYLPSGLPVCCGALIAGTGGAGGGGTASVIMNEVVSGGLAIGGATTEQTTANELVEGGLAIGGATTEQTTANELVEGGLAIGGATTEGIGFNEMVEGGLAIGGATTEGIGFNEMVEGGLMIGGEVHEQVFYNELVAGGLAIGGATTEQHYVNELVAGGLAIGGASTESWVVNEASSGGLAIGGNTNETFTPGGSTPVNTCSTANALTNDVPVSPTTGGTTGSVWYHLSLGGGPFHVQIVSITGFTSLHVWFGSGCGSLVSAGTQTSPGRISYFASPGNDVWIEVASTSGFSGAVTFFAGPGL